MGVARHLVLYRVWFGKATFICVGHGKWYNNYLSLMIPKCKLFILKYLHWTCRKKSERPHFLGWHWFWGSALHPKLSLKGGSAPYHQAVTSWGVPLLLMTFLLLLHFSFILQLKSLIWMKLFERIELLGYPILNSNRNLHKALKFDFLITCVKNHLR